MIKRKFIDYTMQLIQQYYPHYSNDQLKKLSYGLDGIYLTISKLIVLMLLSIILSIYKEVALLVILFSIIRLSASGAHASKSWICLITTLIIFLSIPIILKHYLITFNQKLFIGIICLVFLGIYAPADTKKRPLLNKKKRYRLKIASIITALIFIISSIYLKSNVLTNSLISAILIETIMVLPITYKLYNQQYRNYKEGL